MHFNDRIKIVAMSQETDESGFPLGAQEFATCFCRYMKKSGTEILKSDAVVSQEKVLFTVRYSPKTKELLLDPLATKKYTVIFNGSEYDIKNISDYKGMKKYVDLVCELRV